MQFDETMDNTCGNCKFITIRMGVPHCNHVRICLNYDCFEPRENQLAVLLADNAALRAELAALKEQTRWIPVGERLPDDNDDVLVWRVEGYHEIGCHSSGLWWGGTVMDEAIDVTHWMPLQEPPEVEHEK